MLFATMTRGAFISLVIGMIYMAYACRKDLNFVRFASLIIIAVVLVLALDMIVAQHTISGSLLTRLVQENKYVHGIPYNRYWAWVGAVNRAREHLIIGHGPGWDFSRGLKLEFWPHNAYLFYLDIGGLFGLFGFVFLLVRLVKASFVSWKSSLVRSPLPEAFMKILNVSLVIFIIDQMKIDYLRNTIYLYFVWFFFGLIAATRNMILEKESIRLASSPSR
jgi:O-antigen ligase